MSEDLKKVLLDLASLNNHKNSKVALSARQVSTLVSYPLLYLSSSARF